MSKLETNTIDTISGTNTLQVGDGNVATINLGKSGDTINVPSGATLNVAGTVGTGLTNTPFFHAYGSQETVSNATYTKLGLENTYYNTGSGWDTTNDKFVVPSGGDGKYVFFGSYRISNDSGHLQANIYKNGTRQEEFTSENGYSVSRYWTVALTTTLDLSAGDYIEFYAYLSVGNANAVFGKNFLGYKLIG